MKKAVLIGINTFKFPQFNLRGCINDTLNLQSILVRKFGFNVDDIIIMLDREATKNNIILNLKKLIADSKEGDTLVFAVSTHGTQSGTNVMGEEDGKNEAIVPWEANFSSLILDDEIHEIVTSRGEDHLSKINFTGIYDLCHSGTMIREYALLDASFDETFANRCIFLPELNDLVLKAAAIGPYTTLSACLDNETAADLNVDGVFRGAFSYALHNIIENEPSIKVSNLEGRVLELIKKISNHAQTPTYFEGKEESLIFANP